MRFSSIYRTFVSAALLAILVGAPFATSQALASVGTGKSCAEKDFLKTVKANGRYYLCSEGAGGLQWFETKAPAQTKRENAAQIAKETAIAKYKTQAQAAWYQVGSASNSAYKKVQLYQTGSTGNGVPLQIAKAIYGLALSSANAYKAYGVAPNATAATWANQAVGYCKQLRSLKNSYSAAGGASLSAELSIIDTYCYQAAQYTGTK